MFSTTSDRTPADDDQSDTRNGYVRQDFVDQSDGNDRTAKSPSSCSLGRMDTFKIPVSDVESDTPRIGTGASMQRLNSVDRDARHIVALLNTDNFDAIYSRLKELRDRANRTEIVTNEVLERTEPSSIIRDAETVKLSVLEMHPNADINSDQICKLLEEHKHHAGRMEIVQKIVLKDLDLKKESTSLDGELGEGDIVNFLQSEAALVSDLESIIAHYPSVDPQKAFKLLITKFINSEHRVTDVINHLAGSSSIADNRDDQTSTRDSLMEDTDVIAAIFPRKDKNEIYAYLEANYHKGDRVQLVMEELLKMANNNPDDQRRAFQKSNKTSLVTQRTKSFKRGKKQAKHEGQQWKKMKQISEPFPELQREKEVELLRAIFPDCDPDFLFSKLETMVQYPDRVHRLSEEMFENTDYPKLQERLRKEQKARRRNQILNQELDVDYFLVLFRNPQEVYDDKERNVNKSYKEHALIQLQNDFPLLSLEYIKEQLDNNNGTYYPTKADIDDLFDTLAHPASDNGEAIKEKLSKHILPEPRPPLDFPDTLNEYFFKELLFVKNRSAINDHVRKLNEEKEQKEDNRMDCDVCCDDNLSEEDFLHCEDTSDHKFCIRCVHKHIAQGMSQALLQFKCMDEDCSSVYTLDDVKRVLSSSDFSLLLRRMQEDEIRRAAIKDLVSCPFCSFATIMSDPNDRVFKCLNPECFRESCRLCREPNHVPLRCEEILRLGETNMRSYIEKRMTESMLRVCWRCKKRFFKTEGCNRMQCPCGASMCYLCKCPLRDYDHFEGYGDDVPGKCQLYGEALDLHWQEMKKAAFKAKREWVKMYPEDAEKAKDFNPFDITNTEAQEQNKSGDDADKMDTTVPTTETEDMESVPSGSNGTADVGAAEGPTSTSADEEHSATLSTTVNDEKEEHADLNDEQLQNVDTTEKDVEAASDQTGTTERIAEEATDQTGTTEKNVEEVIDQTGTTEKSVEEAIDQTLTTEKNVEEAEQTGTTEKSVEEATDQIGATEKSGAEAVEQTGTTERSVEEAAEQTGTTEKSVEEAVEQTGTTDKTEEEAADQTGTTEKAIVEADDQVDDQEDDEDDEFRDGGNNPLVHYYNDLDEEDIEELEELDSISDGEFEEAMEAWRKANY